MLDYGFTDWFAIGAKVDYGSDFYDVSSFEALGFLRFYLLDLIPYPLFVQAGAGYISLFEDKEKRADNEDELVSTVLVDASIGIRFPLGNFYTEQYIRGGWPTGFGFGLAIGYRFGAKQPEPPPPEPSIALLPPVTVVREAKIIPVDGVEYTPEGRVTTPEILFGPHSTTLLMITGADAGDHDIKIVENNIRGIFNIAAFLRENPVFTLLIEGHANPVLGTGDEEMERLRPMSLARAMAVKTELVNLGIKEERLIAIGAGGSQKSVDSDAAVRQRNRRVEFYLYRNMNSEAEK
jgi:outer membrane protein OmpA-like peptidoglycan-associated protein